MNQVNSYNQAIAYLLIIMLNLIIKMQNQSQKTNINKSLQAIIYIHSNRYYDQSHLTSILVKTQPLLNLFTQISKIEPPIDRYKINAFIINAHYVLTSQCLQLTEINSIWRKVYTQILIGCILQNNEKDGEHFLSQLLSFIHSLKNIQQIMFMLFGITSLVAIQRYKIDLNKEYKYNQNTKALFFYLLSQIQYHRKSYFIKNCKDIIEKQTRKSIDNPLLESINDQINNHSHKRFFSKIVKIFLEKESYYLQKRQQLKMLQQASNLYKIIYEYIDNKWGIQLKNIDDLDLLMQTQDKDLIILLKTVLSCKQPIILSSLFNTNLVKKMQLFTNNSIIIVKRQEKMAQYMNMVKAKSKGDIQKYKRCREGMNLKKCNFHNKDIKEKFVYLTEEGIFWGKDKKSSSKKYEWKSIKGFLYGSITTNFVQNFKINKCSKCFSLVLNERTIDFVCKSREQAQIWIEGIIYIERQLKKRNIIKNPHIQSISMTKGYILWKQLFLKLRKQGQPWQLKGKGIAEIKKKINSE